MNILREHDLKNWLEANVSYPPEPKKVVLSDFEVDWADLRGTFTLFLDSTKIRPRVKFSLDSNGWMQFWMPMHHSPMGAPASYPMFCLTDSTNKAIKKGLKGVFGHFRPLGLNKDINKLITANSPVLERIWVHNPICSIKAWLNGSYEIHVLV